MTINVITFGCRLNTYESELIKQAASSAALDNIIIFNSCAVTNEAERQLQQAIRKAKRENPGSKVVVTGCAAQINPAKYLSMPEVSVVIGNEDKTKASSYLRATTEKLIVNDIMSVQETAPQLIDGLENKTRAFLQVQNGCNHRCTFCVIPYARGNSRSVATGTIVDQAKKLISNGYKEIVLTGIDITEYGKDLPGAPTLAQMIEELLRLLPELSRLRLSSIDVSEIDQDLFNLFANEKRLMPHLHLSLQSGDNLILKRMKRRHTREQVIEFCNRIRDLRPDIVFGADIITGFPTESEEMFQNTIDIIDEAGLTYLHVFPYSEKAGTPAARMPQLQKHIRKERCKILRKIGEIKLQENLRKKIGTRVEVIVGNNEYAIASDFSLVKFSGNLPPGSLQELEIINCSTTYLIGA